MKKRIWIKYMLIQVAYIMAATMIAVAIAYVSLNDQYSSFYESKLIDKAQSIAYNTTLLLSEGNIPDEDIPATLETLFSQATQKNGENIYHTLYDKTGRQIISTDTDANAAVPREAFSAFASNIDVVEYTVEEDYLFEDEEHDAEMSESGIGTYTKINGVKINTYSPVFIDGAFTYIARVSADYAPFVAYSESIKTFVTSAIIKGCLVMALFYIAYSIFINLRAEKKAKNTPENTQTVQPAPNERANPSETIKIQISATLIFTALGGLFGWAGFSGFSAGIIKIIMLCFAAVFCFAALIHILRMLVWLVVWFINRPTSQYSAQVTQFIMYLLIFMIVFCYSMQSSYTKQLRLSRLDELRLASAFVAVTIGDKPLNEALRIENRFSAAYNGSMEFMMLERKDAAFSPLDGSLYDFKSDEQILSDSWTNKAAIMNETSGYLLGASPALSDGGSVNRLLLARQQISAYSREIDLYAIDFTLSMAAAVVVFSMLFIELNKLLEVFNNAEHLVRRTTDQYAGGMRALMFLTSMAQYSPLYFFILIVRKIYETNPVSWLPVNIAMMVPLVLITPIIVIGSHVFGRFVKPRIKGSMLIGCIITGAGFLLITNVNNFFIFLLLLIITYTGSSFIYNGLWFYTSKLAEENKDNPAYLVYLPQINSGDWGGYTAGAVLGALVYDKFGLQAAFLFSAGICAVIMVLLKIMVPRLQDQSAHVDSDQEEITPADGQNISFIEFIRSKKTLAYITLMILPLAIVPYFIDQFSPMYAEAAGISPGAVAWTSLLEVLMLVYIAPPITRWLLKKYGNGTLALIANIISAMAMIVFALYSGLVTLFVASALIGLGIGVGEIANEEKYYEIDNVSRYKGREYFYIGLKSVGGQIGTVLFALAFILANDTRYIFLIAAAILIVTVIYELTARTIGEDV